MMMSELLSITNDNTYIDVLTNGFYTTTLKGCSVIPQDVEVLSISANGSKLVVDVDYDMDYMNYVGGQL